MGNNINVLDAIKLRRSIRRYTDAKVSEEQLKTVLDAAILSPSARNRQLRHIAVVKNRELLDEMAEKIGSMLGREHDDYHVFHHAPVVLVLSAEKNETWRKEDIGIMSENIALAALEVGLGTCILGLPQVLFTSQDGKKYLEKMQVPSGYEPILSVTLGVPEDTNVAAKPRNYDVVSVIE